MKHLPRNLRTGTGNLCVYVEEETSELFDCDEVYRFTPPPVAVEEYENYESHELAPPNAKNPWHRVAAWVTRLRESGWAGVVAVAGLVLAFVLPMLPIPWLFPGEQHCAASGIAGAVSQSVAAVADAPHDTTVAPTLQATDLMRHQRADATLHRDGYASIPGGVLYTPESFGSSDGDYDLVIHFHGNVKVVVENAVAAKLNAAIAVINLGVGSIHYENAYAVPGTYEDLLNHVQAAMKRRGLATPRLRRVALSSWSAGYGAISSILAQRRGTDPLDGLLVLDGIHVGFTPGRNQEVERRKIAVFEQAAIAAASGDFLFSITYSEIEPAGYAGSQRTAEHLLQVARKDREVETLPVVVPEYRKLSSMRGAVAKEDIQRLEPMDNRAVGDFHIRGYKGNTAGHHMAHLFQMGSTVFEELAQRWCEYAGYAGRQNSLEMGRERLRGGPGAGRAGAEGACTARDGHSRNPRARQAGCCNILP